MTALMQRQVYQIICTSCWQAEPEMLTEAEALAIDGVLRATQAGSHTGLQSRCKRYTANKFQARCGGALRVGYKDMEQAA